jgi:hypothetical protein
MAASHLHLGSCSIGAGIELDLDALLKADCLAMAAAVPALLAALSGAAA